MTILTVGHSTRSREDFQAILLHHKVRHLVDIRSYPGSRRHPQFNRDSLQQDLQAIGLNYTHLRSLGGLRQPQRQNSPNRGWTNKGFQAYADHMLSEEFQEGLDFLCGLASRETAALMCAEAVPWRCHRQLLSDALVLLRGVEVRHVLGLESVQVHTSTSFARLSDGRLIYPPEQPGLFGS